MNPHMLLLLAAGDDGSTTVAPSLGLIVWTVLLFVFLAALVWLVVRWARSNRDAERR